MLLVSIFDDNSHICNMLLLLLLLYGFVLVAIVAMGWKESIGSPYEDWGASGNGISTSSATVPPSTHKADPQSFVC